MKSKEISTIILSSIILALSYTLLDFRKFYIFLLAFLIIILTNTIFKKAASHFFELKTEIRIWEFSQYWFRKIDRFKKPLPMIWLPILLSIFSKAKILWMPIIEFTSTPTVARIQKRHPQKFFHTTEWHLALIASAGVIANNIFGLIFYFLGWTTLAKLSIYYAMWNLLPISSLDGSKILFGSKLLWVLVFAISFGFLFFALGI